MRRMHIILRAVVTIAALSFLTADAPRASADPVAPCAVMVAAAAGQDVPEPPPPPPESKKVYLTGSRYYSDSSVGGYLRTYTASVTNAEGANVASLVNTSGSAEGRSAWNDFIGRIGAWPGSAGVYGRAQVAGTTSIVDEDGNILGTLDTHSIFGSGLPGLSNLGNPWGNGDYNRVWLGPSQVSVMTQEGQTLDLDVVAFVSVSPIIIDLHGDGKPDVDCGEWRPHPQRFNLKRARLFDIDGCGEADLTEWVGPRNGILVAPADEVRVNGGRQLFGTAVGFVDGYQKLAVMRDTNKDDVVSGRELEGLSVWVDANEDGRCQPDELRTAREVGLESIRCAQTDMRSECTIRGQKRLTWDWWPTVAKVRKSAARH